MILRRLAQNLRDQNWTAIAIEFVLLVAGVFLGIQVANWNETRAERQRERLLLAELRAEIAQAIRQAEIKRLAYEQVGRSGEKSLAFLQAGVDCGTACWPVIVDFFHASQWQAIVVDLPTYDEMRRNGWPRNRAIVDAMEAYVRQARQMAAPLEQPPAYRALVRGLIPLPVHGPYWHTCFALANGEEAYLETCPEGVAPEVAAAGVAAIARHPDIQRTLTEWTGFAGAYAVSFVGEIAAAERALAQIDAELEASE
jgi:hypothetical protein